jgi:hypothetical protein
MKKNRKIIGLIFVVVVALGLTYGWFNSPYTVPLSEPLWSTYNKIFDGQRPGLATDLEFVTVLVGSLIVVSALLWLIWKLTNKTR